MYRSLLLFAALAALPLTGASAQNCRIHKATGKCIYVPGGQKIEPEFAVGDEFPIYDHSMLMNIDRYDLPAVNGAWRYYKAGYFIYRIDVQSHRVLEIVKTVRR